MHKHGQNICRDGHWCNYLMFQITCITPQFHLNVCITPIYSSDCNLNQKSYSTQRGPKWCLHQASKSIFGFLWLSPFASELLWHMCLTGFVKICQIVLEKPCQKGFLLPTLASYDLDVWLPDSQSWRFHALAPLTTCANLHQNWLIHFLHIVLKFGNRPANRVQTDERTTWGYNASTGQSSLAWWRR